MWSLMLIARQLQDGADWDSVTSLTVGVLLFAGVAFLLFLIISRAAKRNRFRRGGAHSRRRHKEKGAR